LVGAHELHREIDCGMIRHVEPENLRCAKQKGDLDARRVGGASALEIKAEQMAERSQPAEHERDQSAHQRTIAVRKRRKTRVSTRAIELLIERPPAHEYGFEDIGRDPARRKARRLRRRRGAMLGHSRCVARKGAH
jgi:hypothetical protein